MTAQKLDTHNVLQSMRNITNILSRPQHAVSTVHDVVAVCDVRRSACGLGTSLAGLCRVKSAAAAAAPHLYHLLRVLRTVRVMQHLHECTD